MLLRATPYFYKKKFMLFSIVKIKSAHTCKHIFFLLFILVLNSSFSQVNLNSKLLAYYPFNGDAKDYSGNNNNPIFNNTTLTSDRFGNSNSACLFNGIDNYIQIPSSVCLDTGTAVSVSFWIKINGFYTGTCHGNCIINKGLESQTNYEIIYSDAPYSATLGINQCNTSVDTTHESFYGLGSGSTNPYIHTGEWYFVVYQNDGKVSNLYVNGKLVGSQNAALIPTNNDLFLGRYFDISRTPYWLNGVLDEVRIYGRAITPLEVDSLYQTYGTNPAPTNECNSYLDVQAQTSGVRIGDLDITGNKLTVEAVFNRTKPYTGGHLYAGDLVSKHSGPSDDNYLLRPDDAEIATDAGFFITPDICDIQLNKTYHVAMVYDGDSLKFYRDGYLMSAVAARGNLLTNNWLTTIGSRADTTTIVAPESLLGYINEVRIWNVARPQDSIRAYMDTSLPNPTSQNGLLAYYKFNSLTNLQGNSAWNGSLIGSASINQTNPNCPFILDSCGKIVTPTPLNDCANPNNLQMVIRMDTASNNPTLSAKIGNNYPNAIAGFDKSEIAVFAWTDNTHGTPLYNGRTLQLYNISKIPTNAIVNSAKLHYYSKTNGALNGVIGQPTYGTNNALLLQKCTNSWNANTLSWNNQPLTDITTQKILPQSINTAEDYVVDITDFAQKWVNRPDSNFGFLLRMQSEDNPYNSMIFEAGTAKDTTRDARLEICYRLFDAPPAINFFAPDTVCVNAPVSITNLSTNATTNYWNFCTGNLNNTPICTNLGNVGNNFSNPVFMDYAEDNGNYYGFVVNFNPGGITRLNFGNSLLNTPTSVFLGNVGNKMNTQVGSEGIQLVKNNGNWFAFVVGGSTLNGGGTPKLLKISFGPSLTNISPTVDDYGNIGGMSQSIKLNMQNINGHWYGFSVNADNNTVTRFDFTSDLNNTPTAVNLGNVGNLLAYPTGINLIETNGNWYGFVTNDGAGIANSTNSYLVRLDFGNSLLNTPTAVNLGNPNGVLSSPRDLYIFKQCDATIGYAVNYDDKNDLVRFNIDDNLLGITNAVSLGNIGNFSFPHSINRMFRVGADVYSFVTNVANNTITRLQFPGCTNASIPNSSQINPPSITYNTPGTYNINLTIDEGLPTQSSFCKPIVALPPSTNLDFDFKQDVCNPLLITFSNKSVPLSGFNYKWDFGDGSYASALNDITAYKFYNNYGSYDVKLTNTSGCADTIIKKIPVLLGFDSLIINKDTTICSSTPIQLEALPANSFCWKPSIGLSDSTVRNPIASPKTTTTYYLNTQSIGANLVANGDFSKGNANFYSDYRDSINGYHEGTYTIDTTAATWHPYIAKCHDHTTGNGKMLLANGSPNSGAVLWQQTINNVKRNATYIFSTWVQSLSINNPAKIQFYVNNQPIGSYFTAILDTCNWQQPLVNWNSGNNTTAILSIVNMDTIGDGNDFAIDDISFSELTTKTDSIKITVNNFYPSPTVDTTVCLGKSVQLIAKTATFYSWASSPYITNTTIQSQMVTPTNNTSFTVERHNDVGCIASDTFKVNVSTKKPVLNFSYIQDVCNPLSVHFYNQSSDSFSYSWNLGNNNVSIDSNPSVIYNSYNSYKVTLQNTSGCIDSISKTLILNVSYDSIIITHDTSICIGQQLQLNTVPALSYCWLPNSDLNATSITNPIVTPTSTATYYVNAQVLTKNLIVNGDFEQGNIGFNSSYKYDSTSGIPEGVYWVSTSPHNPLKPWHPSFSNCSDHTTGKGNMMLINGASVAGVAVWEEQLLIKPNTDYAFSVWLGSIGRGNPAELQFSINGKIVGLPFNAAYNTCIWKQFYIIWNSGNSTTADISIVNLNTTSNGNDFALDDISFSEFKIATDSIHVNIIPKPNIKLLNKDTSICNKDSFQLSAIGGVKYLWNPHSFLSDTTIAHPIAYPNKSTLIIVTGFSSFGCYNKDSITVTVKSLPVVVLKDTGVCKGDSVILSANSDPNNNYQWQQSFTLSANNISNPTAFPKDTTTYFLTVTNKQSCTIKDSVTVSVWALPIVQTIADTSICINSSIILQSKSNGISYNWNPLIGLDNSSLLSPRLTINSLNKQAYVLTALGDKGCSNHTKVNVTGLSLPAISISPIFIDTICMGKSVSITALSSNANSYLWYPSSAINNIHANTVVVNPNSTTKYYVMVTGNNLCTATDSVVLNVKQLPQFAITPLNATICEGESVLVTASGGNKYDWQSLNVAFPNSSSNVIYPSQSTSYVVIATDTICSVQCL